MRQNVNKLSKRMAKNASKKHGNFYNLQDILAATTVGAISFPLALGFMQNFILKPLRISCKLPNAIVSAVGGMSVIASGIFASDVFVLSCESLRKSALLSVKNNTAHRRFNLEFKKTEENMLIYGAGSLLVFKIFGGKMRQVVPSHLFHPGAFAKISVPAAGKDYAGLSAKRKLNILGRRYGCHSCGKRRQNDFIADHMPPNKLVKFYQPQVFYPQCKPCSQKQGGALSSMNKFRAIQTHSTTLRKYHLWLPVPLVVAFAKNALEDEDSKRIE